MDALIERSVAEWGRPDRESPMWRGKLCQQFPADLWRYAQLIWEYTPPFVIEVGANEGGTASYLADLLTLTGTGRVISIDIDHTRAVGHERVTFICGDSTRVINQVRSLTGESRGLVLLDGGHEAWQVRRELELYADLADYLIVEDTIMRWLPEYQNEPGPADALDDWLPRHPEFRADPDPVPGPTQHPGGWLRRIR